MLKVIDPVDHRATMDIDLLGRVSNDEENILKIFQNIAAIKCEYDAIEYVGDGIKLRRAQLGGPYTGYSLNFRAQLFKSRIPMHIDVGFNDEIVPAPQAVSYPAMLEMPEIQMEGYSFELVVAEKLEAMTKHGLLNTRMKDFYDVWTISQTYHLDEQTLLSAVERVFHNRGTKQKAPASFSPEFSRGETANNRWNAFLRTIGKKEIDLDEVITQIKKQFGYLFQV